MPKRICAVDGCEEWSRHRAVLPWEGGWCDKHYGRWTRHGDPTVLCAERACDDCGVAVTTPRRKLCEACALERRRQRWRAYKAADPDRETERHRRYREQHREELNQAARDERARNPERRREVKRAFRERHDERVRAEDRQRSHERRARIRETTIEAFSDLEIFERDAWRCQLCGGKVAKSKRHPDPMSPSLDHIIPLALGGTHTRANVQLAHLGCNVKKHTRAMNEQLRLVG